jgi:hypothetical protein
VSHAIQAIIGVVEIVVGAILDVYGISAGNILIKMGVAQLLGYAISLLQNPHRAPLQPIAVSYAGTLEPRRIIYGKLKVGGMYTIPPLTAGPNNDFLEIVFTVAGHPVSGFGDMYFNQIRIANADIGSVTGVGTDGAVTNTITNNGYNGFAWLRRYDGTQRAVDYILTANFTAWDSTHIGWHCAYWAAQLKYDTKVFSTGVPEITGVVFGKIVYDPRLDTRAAITFTQNNVNTACAANLPAPGLTITKTNGTNAFDAQCYSTETPGQAWVRFYAQASAANQANAVVGLSQNPASTVSYTNIDHAFNPTIGVGDGRAYLYIYESGASQGYFGGWNSNTRLEIVYDGTTVRYLVDNIVVRSVVNAGKTFHFKAALDYSTDKLTNVEFGGSGTGACWAYSTNTALCLRDYLTSPLGLNEPHWRIDDTLTAAAANICDQTVTVPAYIVPGLTQWTSASATVAGLGTNFLRDLNFGQFTGPSGGHFTPTSSTYIEGPDGVMHLIATVESDISLTLAASYASSSAYDIVAQWNNSTALTVTQKRYTCNVLLDASARFEDNASALARAMMGQVIYSGGKWRMYAGAWSGSTFSLSETDLVGGLSVQCSTPRQNLYNAVRGNFINPAKNYQPDEFPAILNPAYSVADGETIYTETNFPCCTDVFEAQRNAFIVSRVSRDQKVVTGQFGMSAYGIRVWDTGTLSIAELGWVNQSVRCIGWRFTPKGAIELQLQEAYSADWQDPVSGAYALIGANATGALQLYTPYPITAFGATPMPGAIMFSVQQPANWLSGQVYQLYENTTNTTAGASLILVSADTSFAIQKADVLTRYYWVAVYNPGTKQQSALYPGSGAGTGLAAAAGAPTLWNAYAQCYPTDNGLAKFSGVNGWSGDLAVSQQGFTTAHLSAKTNALSDNWMIGLLTQPNQASLQNYGGTTSYTFLSYAWYQNSGTWGIYESGSAVATYGAVALTDVVAITYDGTTISYLLNGVVQRTVTNAGLTLYAGFTPYTGTAGINSVNFGPTTNLAVVDTMQLGLNAATNLYTAAVGSNGAITGGPTGACTTILSIAVPAQPYAYTAVITFTGPIGITSGASGGGGVWVAILPVSSIGTLAYDSTASNASLYAPLANQTLNTKVAVEATYSVAAGVAQTFTVKAGMSAGGVGGSAGYGSDCEVKVEVIKR